MIEFWAIAPLTSPYWRQEGRVLQLAHASGAQGCGCVVVISCARVQAKHWCTPSKARKVVVSLTVVALATESTSSACGRLADVYVVNTILIIVFKAILSLAVLVINVMVACQVRRAATNAAANLGVQPHHQSTSSNSVVPTVMLIATSIIYVLLYSGLSILETVRLSMSLTNYEDKLVWKSRLVVESLVKPVFAYNFYVYMITGKQFRSELHKLFCCCLSSFSFSSSSSPAAAAAAAAAVVVVSDDNDNAELSRRAQAEATF